MPACVIYNRTSTDDQNPENQLKDCISINHYGDYIILQDKASAWKDTSEREDFDKLKKMIRAGEVSHLIVWDFDRLYRNRAMFKEFLQFLHAYKVKLHSYRQTWIEEINKIPAPWNDIVYSLLIDIFGWLAEEESKKKSERVKSAVRRGDKGTVSYKGNRWGRKPIPESTIKQVLELHKQGLSLRAIKKEAYYYTNSNNKKYVSLGLVHKILKENIEEKG